jgi:hypothetical protein
MTWETRDSLDKIHTFYVGKLNEGDWYCGFPTTPCGQPVFGGYIFNVYNKSNPHRILEVQVFAPNASGVTKIEAIESVF